MALDTALIALGMVETKGLVGAIEAQTRWSNQPTWS